MKPKILYSIVLLCAALATVGLMGRNESGLIVHEWGTFTSVQGSDGKPIFWKPLQTTDLPKFVHDWRKPGLNRQSGGAGLFTKGAMVTLQRMETPVIYFYSDKPQTVDLSVGFPKGQITEWYPQVREIGPSYVPRNQTLLNLDGVLQRHGMPQTLALASAFGERDITNSVAHWENVEILPARTNPKLAALIPVDSAGSHYFAARETDAAYVRTPSLSHTNPSPEYEKFLFYRGAGSFPTPMLVTTTREQQIHLKNEGAESLKHLFIVEVKGNQGKFKQVDKLGGGKDTTLSISQGESMPMDKFAKALGDAMEAALVKEGLYPREAKAMVNTWNTSWFQEEGVRVLYVLPRAWTDSTLPLQMTPAPKSLVRVMVGRAEVITAATEQHLVDEMLRANQGDLAARDDLKQSLNKLGRFGEAAFNLAWDKCSTKLSREFTFYNLVENPKLQNFE